MHISRIGRRSWRVRLGLLALYLILSLGAVTTVYPFLLMLSTAMKSQSDFNDYTPAALVPRYFREDRALYVKYLEDRYANNIDDLNGAHHADYARVTEAAPPASGAESEVARWNAFVATLPPALLKAGFGEHENAPSPLLIRFRAFLRQTYNNDLARLNAAWTEENVSFDAATPPVEKVNLRAWSADLSRPKVQLFEAFKKTLPADYRVPTFADPLWRRYLKEDVYGGKLDALNAAWQTHYTRWTELTLPLRAPRDASYTDWETFVRTKFPLRMLVVDPTAEPAWHAFLARRNRPRVALPAEPPHLGQELTDWMEFIKTECPVSALTAAGPENRWRAAYKLPLSAQPPQAEADWAFVQKNGSTLRPDFATRNFRAVFNYIAINGRAATNTVVFCLLSILAAIIINPLCAYALSRYPLPYAYKVLLFLLATMAFPAEVAMIPNFLLLKQLHLLNTLGALILPGLANGYSIFLLKGFFDSLPKELYEAGILDGATELAMFRRITMPLSLPIFSVIALNAFTGAYGAFLFALVVCQDPKMWTLMVYLYNMQSQSPQYVIFAALTVTAIPTLVIFLLAQKVILRGIVLPSFK